MQHLSPISGLSLVSLRATASGAEHAVRGLRDAWRGYNQPDVLTPPCLDSWELLEEIQQHLL